MVAHACNPSGFGSDKRIKCSMSALGVKGQTETHVTAEERRKGEKGSLRKTEGGNEGNEGGKGKNKGFSLTGS